MHGARSEYLPAYMPELQREVQRTNTERRAMPRLLQLSVDGTWTAKATAQELLFLLKDCSNYGSRNKQSRSKDIEQIMQDIYAAGEKVDGMSTTVLRLVEWMLAKISSGR
ncbi:hypothetical protein ACFX15_044096 [Malus domestica]